jgi:pectinesterase
MQKLAISVLLVALRAGFAQLSAYDVVVDARYTGRPGDRIDNKPHFAALGQALLAAPAAEDTPCRIFIRAGRYYEKVTVERSNIHLIGESREESILSFDACGDTPNPAGGTFGTWGCATLLVKASGFTAENLTLENGFDYPANALKADGDPSKRSHAQAVAVMCAAGSDRAAFRNCVISGFQDTLFPNAGRSCFVECRILGHVDFIFGAGQAVFERCEIVSRNRSGKDPTGYITAPSTPISHPYGFLFIGCQLLKETLELAAGSVRLGRPWHPHGDPQASGSAVFLSCYMDDHLGIEGYAAIGSTDSTGNKHIFEVGPESRFFEFDCRGPGAVTSPKRPLLRADAAAWYSADQVLRGWKPF